MEKASNIFCATGPGALPRFFVQKKTPLGAAAAPQPAAAARQQQRDVQPIVFRRFAEAPN